MIVACSSPTFGDIGVFFSRVSATSFYVIKSVTQFEVGSFKKSSGAIKIAPYAGCEPLTPKVRQSRKRRGGRRAVLADSQNRRIDRGTGCLPFYCVTAIRYNGNSAHATTQVRFWGGNRLMRMWESRLHLCKIVRWQIGTKCDRSEARNTYNVRIVNLLRYQGVQYGHHFTLDESHAIGFSLDPVPQGMRQGQHSLRWKHWYVWSKPCI